MAGQTIRSPLEVEDAQYARDAFVKDLYNKMFDWLVARVNETLETSDGVKSMLGILDIYGFENLKSNGFEQLLINYANEKMQSLFNEEVFRAQRKGYVLEGIPFSNIQDNLLNNNDDSLTIIESPSHGILSLIDEQGLLGIAGSDQALVAKMRQNFGPDVSISIQNSKMQAFHPLGAEKLKILLSSIMLETYFIRCLGL